MVKSALWSREPLCLALQLLIPLPHLITAIGVELVRPSRRSSQPLPSQCSASEEEAHESLSHQLRRRRRRRLPRERQKLAKIPLIGQQLLAPSGSSYIRCCCRWLAGWLADLRASEQSEFFHHDDDDDDTAVDNESSD